MFFYFNLMNHIISFFQRLFESINIYKMLLIYPLHFDINKLIELLVQKDYPITKGINADYRIYALDNFTESTDISDITCILCIGDDLYNKTRFILKQHKNIGNLVLFSL